jgi:hypothetical protein
VSEAIVHTIAPDNGSPFTHMIFCPGCKCGHGWDARPGGWTFNGDLLRPTISPSLLVRWNEGKVPKVCHSFIKDGQIQFLGDCTHELAGQTVPLEPF